MRGYMDTFYQNIALWHERDISHSSTERIILPDATELLDYMLNRFKGILENLTVFPDKMIEDINLTHGVIFAQRVLYKLIEKGFVREKAYDTVQPIAMKALETKTHYRDLLKQDETIKSVLTDEEIDSCFTLDYYLANVDYIYNRLGLK